MSHLAKNIAAIALHFPALAEVIECASIPEGFLPTAGSDGTPTFCRVFARDGKKCREWLGATSMPAASASAITASFDAQSNGASGLGLSIGTGYEWAAFIGRLGRAQLVYVYEADSGLLRMALEICDLAALLAARRLVLLTGGAEAAAETLAGFLAAHTGFDPPSVLHPLPTLVGARRGQLLAAGEAIVRRAVTERHGLVGQLVKRIETALGRQAEDRKSEIENHLALLLAPRYAAERPIQQEAGRRRAQRIVIDRHDSASLALRLGTLADMLTRGPVRILSDLFREQLQPLPAEVPVETWIPPLIGPAFWDRVPAAATIAPHDRIIVHAPHHARLLQGRGIAQNQIELRLLRGTTAPAPIENRGDGKSKIENPLTLRHRIALIADLPVSDATALGVELPTHRAVFAAAREMIEADYLTVHPGMAADILRRALARAGVDSKSDDPALKEPMLRLITHVLIPAQPPLKLAQVLAAEGVALTLVGDWPNLQLTGSADVRRVAFDAYDLSAWEDVAVLAHVAPQGVYSPLLLDAIGGGVPIASPTPPNPAESALHAVLQPEIDFAEAPARNYIVALKSLLRDAPRRQKLAAAAHLKLATNEHE